MHQMTKKILLAFVMTLVACNEPNSAEEEQEEKTTPVNNTNTSTETKKTYLFTYDSINSVWNYEEQKCTTISAFLENGEWTELRKYDSIIETSETPNQPTKIGEYDFIKISMKNSPFYNVIKSREIYITDIEYGNSLINFGNKNSYKKVDNSIDEKLYQKEIGQIFFEEKAYILYSSGYVGYADENEEKFISSEPLNTYDLLTYCLCNNSFYFETNPLHYFEPSTSDEVLIFTKQNKQVILNAKETTELFNNMEALQSFKDKTVNKEVYFGKKYIEEAFEYGVSIMFQTARVNQDGLLYSDNIPLNYNFVDPDGNVYVYRPGAYIFSQDYTDLNVSNLFYETPFLEKYEFNVDYEIINELF